ncbi:MAG: FAD-dependent oxidoreductase [Bryobacterales bacterium]|nr:FAD-dependent oxidoreductase [Bryobacterales bacterium]
MPLVTLTGREEIARGTMAFHFSRPADFDFRAGQAIDLTLIDPPETDEEGNTRAFSVVCAPFENQLMVATRMRDTAFKRVLKSLPLGTAVKLEGPSGSFVLHRKAEKPAVFLAGGIGITPFSSIIRQATHDNAPHQLYLFYSNRRPEDTAFLDVLNETAKNNPRFHFIPTMTKMENSAQEWHGETGHIDRDLLVKSLSSLQGPIYYMAGPPAMVTAMRWMLVKAGVDEDDIRSEEFSGY